MTLNEAYCLTTACRRVSTKRELGHALRWLITTPTFNSLQQLPRRPPEPFSGGSTNAAAIAGVAHSVPSLGTGTNLNSEESGFNSMGSQSNGEANSNDMENYEEAESLMSQQPTKVRPPAKFFLGQPQKYKNPRKCPLPLPLALLPPMAPNG